MRSTALRNADVIPMHRALVQERKVVFRQKPDGGRWSLFRRGRYYHTQGVDEERPLCGAAARGFFVLQRLPGSLMPCSRCASVLRALDKRARRITSRTTFGSDTRQQEGP